MELASPRPARSRLRADARTDPIGTPHLGSPRVFARAIAFHTAFLVFGSARFFDLGLSGSLSFLPWVLPAVIGITANRIVERKYRRRFGDLPAREGGARAPA